MTERILSGFRKAAHVIRSARQRGMRSAIWIASARACHRGRERLLHPSCSPLPDAKADADLRRLLPSDDRDFSWLLNVEATYPGNAWMYCLRVVRRSAQQRSQRAAPEGGRLLQFRAARAGQATGSDSAVLELGSVSRELLAAVYRRAGALLHTADAEGFGLPLIEAWLAAVP